MASSRIAGKFDSEISGMFLLDLGSLWDIVKLEQIPMKSSLLIDNHVTDYRTEMEESSLCPYISVEGSWDEYFKKFSKKFKRDIKHKSNRMNRFGEWEFKVEKRPENLEEMFTHMEIRIRLL